MSWKTSTHYAWRLRTTCEEQTHLQDDLSQKHTRRRPDGNRRRFPERGKAKENPARARRAARKDNEATQAKVTVKRQQSTRASMVRVETAESMDTKAADCWYKQPPKPQGEGKVKGKSKSKVPEISDSDSSEQVEETWTPNTSTPSASLSQVNTIGCADEGLWTFSLEDSKKREHA